MFADSKGLPLPDGETLPPCHPRQFIFHPRLNCFTRPLAEEIRILSWVSSSCCNLFFQLTCNSPQFHIVMLVLTNEEASIPGYAFYPAFRLQPYTHAGCIVTSCKPIRSGYKRGKPHPSKRNADRDR